MRARTPAILLLALACLPACRDDERPATPRDAAARPADAARPDAAPDAKTPTRSAKRRKIPLPPPAPPSREAAKPPPIERLDAHRVRVGKVLVDRRRRRIEVPGRLNMTEGILEYYAVVTGGKLHESVLELFIQPSHLHLGLLLAGLEPNVYREDQMGMRQVVKPGGRLRLFVEWTDPKSGERRREPASKWLYNRAKKAAPPPQKWAFLGSVFWNGRYVADDSLSVVGLIPDDTCVVGIMGDAGNPYRGDDLGYEVNTAAMPPLGTPVTLVLEAVDGPATAPAPGSSPTAPADPASAPAAPASAGP